MPVIFFFENISFARSIYIMAQSADLVVYHLGLHFLQLSSFGDVRHRCAHLQSLVIFSLVQI